MDYIEIVAMYHLHRLEGWLIHRLAFIYHKNWKGREVLHKKNALDQLKVLHKSEQFLVVDKQADLVINTEPGDDRLSLFHQIRHSFPELYQPNLGHGFYVLHRLDYSTSGVLVVPLTKKAASQAMRQFEERKTKKYYLALVRGHVSEDCLEINVPIGDDSRPEWSRLRMSTPSTDPGCMRPREARTKLLVLERGQYNKQPATKVLLAPLTGRRHQLRYHCHYLGHTIVGDWVYSNRRDVLPHRMFLHAYRLVLSTKLEHLDITSGPDPFSSSDPTNLWTPSSTPVTDLTNAYHELSTGSSWTLVH